MRARLRVLVALTTSLVLVAFLVPLGLLVRQAAVERATSAALSDAEAIAPLVGAVEASTLRDTLDQLAVQRQQDFPLTVFLPDGVILGHPVSISPAIELARTGRSLTAERDGGREVLVAHGGADGTTVIRAFATGAQLTSGVARTWAVLGFLGAVLFVLSLLVADRLARSIIIPMDRLIALTHRLGRGDLNVRASDEGPPEVRQVARALNALADRIGQLLTAEREDVADLSHELRTPLTGLRLGVDALAPSQAQARLAGAVETMQAGIDRVIREARRPIREGAGTGCDAVPVLRERVAFWAPLAQDEDREVTVKITDGVLPVAASLEDLAAAVDALLGNVFAHTEEAVAFAVQLTAREGGGARLIVADDGPGTPDGAELLRRGTSGQGSSGLGLDIVRRTARATGGDLRVTSGLQVGGTDQSLSLGGVAFVVDLGPPPGSAAPTTS